MQDRELSYVQMSRHRAEAHIFTSIEDAGNSLETMAGDEPIKAKGPCPGETRTGHGDRASGKPGEKGRGQPGSVIMLMENFR